jgi:N-glycosidase YbiA
VSHYPLRIYFYKVDAPYGCFSNFSPHSIKLDGEVWATVEHYYQAHKFQHTEFEYLMAEIHTASTPELAAAIGRNCEHQPQLDWDLVKCEIMYRAICQKFSQHQDIQQILIDTLTAEIIEDSPRDYFWGCGHDRTGQNQLGQILMRVRAELRDQLKI